MFPNQADVTSAPAEGTPTVWRVPHRRAQPLQDDPAPELRFAWPKMDWPLRPLRAATPRRRDVRTLRALIVAAALMLVSFLAWLLQPDHRGNTILFWTLTVAFLVQATMWGLEWFNYWRISVPPPIPPLRQYTVDVFTTACPGEPLGMILRTLLAMKAIRYPHTNYLCDEGDNFILRRICRHLGIVHVTRTEKKHAKAGNINNALAQSNGELCVVLDPDHEPSPEMLDRLVGYFDDDKVGFVQSVQGYRNQDASLVARGAAEQTYHFYGPIMMGMHGRGTTQAIGANCVFRRTALESIGGHASGLAEDMHTSMQLYAAGWKSAYVPEVLTRGLVPATLSAYYKQQVKWSCGAFDLLFQSYPKLFRRFTIWQKIHYFLAPFYFLSGLANTICIVVPIVCLLTGLIAWRVGLMELLMYGGPILALNLLIRQTAQRFVLEPSERGFHLAGGLLMIGSWWVFLTGVLCAIFRVKVPYIPTPKEDEPVNDWKMATPNFIAAGLSAGAAGVGIWLDNSPPALLMATLACWNAIALCTVGCWGLQCVAQGITSRLGEPTARSDHFFSRAVRGTRAGILAAMRRWSPALALLVVAAAVAGPMFRKVAHRLETQDLTHATSAKERDPGLFLVGVNLNGEPANWASQMQKRRPLWGDAPRLVAVSLPLGQPSTDDTTSAISSLIAAGDIPLVTLTWQGIATAPETRPTSSPAASLQSHLHKLATTLREAQGPVLLRPAFGGLAGTGLSPDEWRRMVELYSDEAASNVGWVWTPDAVESAAASYPGDAYVDWIALKPSSQHDTVTGQERLKSFNKPLVLLGGATNENLLAEAYASISGKEAKRGGVHAVVLADAPAGGSPTKDAVDPLLSIAWPTKSDRALQLPPPSAYQPRPSPGRSRPCVTGTPGAFELTVSGKPFFIKGVAYNPGHDWRDGDTPLTRQQLTEDFKAIREMGGNTVRRYGKNWSDRNIFNAAESADLKVLYGFWFDHDVDFLRDHQKRAEYERDVDRIVLAYRDHPGLLGWTLGNETWGLLKHHYAQPYLTHVRAAYVQFVEQLARRIKSLDPDHPVMVVHEHAQDLPGNVLAFARGAPTLDAQGVNSYYEPHISSLATTFARFDPSRPYFVSEFGPDGYWHGSYTATGVGGQALESTALEKAGLYERRWNQHIAGNRGQCVGGVAYCWRDRYEGTTSWFGINDWYGRPKPAYFALRRAWTGMALSEGTEKVRIRQFKAPTAPVLPGSTVEVRADLVGQGRTICTWTVTGRNFEPDVATVTPSAEEAAAQIRMPREPGTYRVHLQVRSEHGLDESNYPIVVAAPGEPTQGPSSASMSAERKQIDKQ